MGFINSFFKSKNKLLERSLLKFRKVNINKVIEIIKKECEENNYSYEEIFYEKNKIIVKVAYKNKYNLIKFHKTLAVSLSEYEGFLYFLNKYDYHKSYYITTGVFQQDVYNRSYIYSFIDPVTLVDGKRFITYQKWFKSNNMSHINYSNLSFKRYFPKQH